MAVAPLCVIVEADMQDFLFVGLGLGALALCGAYAFAIARL